MDRSRANASFSSDKTTARPTVNATVKPAVNGRLSPRAPANTPTTTSSVLRRTYGYPGRSLRARMARTGVNRVRVRENKREICGVSGLSRSLVDGLTYDSVTVISLREIPARKARREHSFPDRCFMGIDKAFANGT